ncbi:ANL_HP_G0017640.mRNA.1.CDS.1 [Saccharomyces cerevisiae]|nr:ANL_HP_G0017640.mRNA.1.CDS.1 [Saccharomyces cerevisiae]CAI6597244.1 ANL_HP_G0017640.mRNA.1.CDS.1 [Saccharomyces cerevisiae]
MEMLLFLNESYIFHRFFMRRYCFLGPLSIHPRSEAYCLSPYSVCSKRPPMEEVILYYPSPDSLIKNRKRVLGVAYL